LILTISIFYKNPVKMTENEKIKRMFRELFELYLKDLETENKESSIYEWFLDNMSEEYLRSNSKPRIVLDYIAGMTDDFFNNEFKRYVLPKSYGYCMEQ